MSWFWKLFAIIQVSPIQLSSETLQGAKKLVLW
jgi:hypothetical protein